MKLIKQIVHEVLLEEATGWKRNRRFRFKPNLDLFGQPQPAEAAGTE